MNDGGPAFPAPEYLINKEVDQKTILRLDMTRGMTLRDWFAGMALQGIVSDSPTTGEWGEERMASYAFQLADAMLNQRGQP